MGEADKDFRVLIIGAGSAGLLTAQALKKQGIRCTVFEQDASLAARPRDWNFGVYWAQVPLDECLPEHLRDQVESAQVDSYTPTANDFMPIFDGKSGEIIKSLPVPFNIRLQRRKFLRLISLAIDIRYGKRLTEIQSKNKRVTVKFEDGSSEDGDLLVGAEGAHSKVREFLVGPQKAALQMSPLVASVAMARLPKEATLQFKTLAPRYLVSFHPNGYFSWIGVHDAYDDQKPGEWTFMIIQSWISERDPGNLTGAKILEDMKARGTLYSEPFATIYQSIPDSTLCWHNRLSYWVTEPWENHDGTVTLVGDAAHPMTFHRGQGLNNAIHDVANLARQIKDKGAKPHSALVSALAAYEQEMWQRGKEAVITSNENSLSTHNWKELLKSPLFTAGLQQKLLPEDSGAGL